MRHAYGPAIDTPKLLRSLTADDDEERSHAIEDLTASICHQGSVYSATAVAVPFLVEVAESVNVPAETRWQVLALLSWIAEGNRSLGGDEDIADLERNLRAAVPRVQRLLDTDGSSIVRAWAAWYIRRLPAGADETAALQASLSTERDPVVRATLVLGTPAQTELIGPQEDPLVRLCAAAQLVPTGTDLDLLESVATEAVPLCAARFKELPDASEDTSAIRLIASRFAQVAHDREVAWIVRWFKNPEQCEEALYAACDASDRSRSTAKALLAPVYEVLVDPPRTELESTAAHALIELGVAGAEALRATGKVSQMLNGVDSSSAAANYDPRAGARVGVRSPSDLSAVLASHTVLDWSSDVTVALTELAAWGPSAKEAVPELLAATERARFSYMRAFIGWVLARVSGDDERLVSSLLADLGTSPTFLALRILGELGRKAARALPALHAIVDSDQRIPDTYGVEDDLLVAAARDAINRIEGA